MEPTTKITGRPKKDFDKKTKLIIARFSESEYNEVVELSKNLGLSLSEYVKQNTLKNRKASIVNVKEMLASLNNLSASIGKAGGNINQLAAHANGRVFSIGIMNAYIENMTLYNALLDDIRGTFKKIYRELRER